MFGCSHRERCSGLIAMRYAYIDVYGVLEDGRYAGDEMLWMAADHEPRVRLGRFR